MGKSRNVDFFVSHAEQDQQWAEWIAWHLKDAGYTVILGAWDWVVGDNIVRRQNDALTAADRVVAVMTSAYFESNRSTQDDWSAALAAGPDGVARLIPVKIEDCTLPAVLKSRLRVELIGLTEEEARRRLLEAASGPRRPGGAPLFPGRGQKGLLTRAGQASPKVPGSLPAVWNMETPNPGFVGREELLRAVFARLWTERADPLVLQGKAGIGKSQLAAAYAHRYAHRYNIVWWVNSEKSELLGDQIAALSVKIGLVERQTDNAVVLQALRDHLRHEGRWLLVFDNAEYPAELHRWLPPGPGHILITSRNPAWVEIADRIEVGPLSPSDSAALIRAYLPQISDADARRLTDSLSNLPLAVAQAGRYLADTTMDVDGYLEQLDLDAAELLDQSPPHTHPQSLTAAIRVSAERLAEIDPSALALARIAAFMAPESIPADLILDHVPTCEVGQTAELSALTAMSGSRIAVHRSLGRARASFQDGTGGGLHLHRLTQAILRGQLRSEEKASYRAHARTLLCAYQPQNSDDDDPELWPRWEKLLPHVLSARALPVDNPDELGAEGRWLLIRASWHLANLGNAQAAYDLSSALVRTWRRRLGPDHEHTLAAVYGVTQALRAFERYEEAFALDSDVRDRRQRIFPDKDNDFNLASANNVAADLRLLLRTAEARELDEDTLARRRRAKGEDHRFTLRTANNLALDLHQLGSVEEARDLNEDTLSRRQRVLGEDHPHTLISASNLARDLHALGRLIQARALNEQTLLHRRRVLGNLHPHTLLSAHNLASDLHALGDREAARRHDAQTLTDRRKILGNIAMEPQGTANPGGCSEAVSARVT